MKDADLRAGLAALVTGFSHELRNPLFGLSATVDALEQRLGDGGLHAEHVRVIRDQVARIVAATDDLVDYGSPRALLPMAASPGEVVRAAARMCNRDAARRRVRLVVAVEAGLPPVIVDGKRLTHALAAIARQAVCLSAPGASLSLIAARAEGFVTLELAGPWAVTLEEDLVVLFEPFRTLRGCGEGLGLAIAKRVIEDHGADVVVAEEEASGRVLRVRLPLGAPDARSVVGKPA